MSSGKLTKQRAEAASTIRDLMARVEEAGQYTEAHERLDDWARERVAAAEAALAASQQREARAVEALERINSATAGSTNSATLAEFQSWVRAVAGAALADLTSPKDPTP